MDDISRYYEILGLKPAASEDEIKHAYRDLVKVWHPDRFAHDPPLQKKASESLKKINEAYQIILDYINKPYEEFSESDTEEQFERSEKSFKSDSTQFRESESENYSDSQPPPESPEPPESSEIPKEPPPSGEFSQKPRPWVRYWARLLDFFYCLS